MAWLEQKPSGQYHVAFRYGTRKFKRSLMTKRKREAEHLLARIERRLELLESGDIDLPSHVDCGVDAAHRAGRSVEPAGEQRQTTE